MNCFMFGLLAFVCCLHFGQAVYKLQERYSWKELDFVFPNEQLKQQAIARGDYIPQNGLPVGIEHWGNRLFVTVPRWRDGIPSTLNYINTDQSVAGSPALMPYPDWRFNVAGDCANSITTAYRIKADTCGRLWVLDTGTVGIGNTTTNPCPYAVNVFDLQTNTRIRHYKLRPEDTNANTFIANIAVDIGKDCDDAFAYFSDELGYGLISYSWKENKSWRFSSHSYFLPDPLRGDFNVAGINYQWGDEGIFGMSLTPIRSDGYRTMYFSPLASHRQFAVSTRILRDETRVDDSYHDFVALAERGPLAHTTSHDMSDDGVELFSLIDQNAVGCWHSSMPYSPEYHNVVDRDDVGLVFPADVKIDENKNVWVLSDRMPVFLITGLDYNDVNFRIYSAPLSTLLKGTVCERGINNHGSSQVISNVNDNCIANKPQYQSSPTLNPYPGTVVQHSPPVPLPTYHTQKVVVPSTYVYNQQNGLTYEVSNGPHLFPAIQLSRQQVQPEGLKHYSSSRNSGWWRNQHH